VANEVTTGAADGFSDVFIGGSWWCWEWDWWWVSWGFRRGMKQIDADGRRYCFGLAFLVSVATLSAMKWRYVLCCDKFRRGRSCWPAP